MKNKKILAIVLSLTLVLSSAGMTAWAVYKNNDDSASGESAQTVSATSSSTDPVTKDETVYVMTTADGQTKKVLVSDWIKNALPEEAQKAVTGLSNAENVKDDCWTGTIEKDLPVTMSIRYQLDGKTVSASELAGKSGRVTIRFDYRNNQYEMKTVNGVSQKIYVPFVALTGALLDTDHFSNVSVSNGKLINDGNHIAVIGMAFPGLQNNLSVADLELPDYVEITADVTDFTMETTLTMVSNSLLNEVDTDEFSGGDLSSLSSSMSKLTDAMSQLLDGSSSLYDGLCTLLESCNQLSDGVQQLAAGLTQLSGNSAALNDGAKQVFQALLATANSQLSAQLAEAGLSAEDLTMENYSEVLSGILAQLDQAGTLAEQTALQQVTAAVNANRDQVEAAVTAAVQETVQTQVTAAAKQEVLAGVMKQAGVTQEQYDGSEQVKAMIDSAVEQQMETAQIQQKIAAGVKQAMASDEVKAQIQANTDQQIQLLIAQNMSSKEVQDKIMAATQQASAGAVQIRSLKQQLDQYNTFYMGLLTYTAGVDQAAAGAGQLQSNMPALLSGVTQLRDGSMQLSDGLKQLNEEGIQKLTQALGDNVEGLVDRLIATVEVSRNYRSFSGISDGMDGEVRFIYRTDAIESAE